MASTFHYDSKQQKLFCDQFKKEGFYLSEKPLLFLGGYKHHMVLENECGEKKVLITRA